MPALSTALVKVLQAHGLLSADQLRVASELAATLPEAGKLAAELVNRGWLTRYQVMELSSGRGKGLVVGPYHLLDLLGKGGMGQVFRARDSVLHRVVALKLILPERLGSQQAVERFMREARAAALLSHPNIVTIYQAGQAGDTFYMAMELLPGCNLAEYLEQRGRLTVAEACEYVREAALGLQHAHERGLVHRDIKPANLLRTDAGQIKVLDLGLALVLEATSLTKHSGATMGTIDYMAPEQVTDAHKVDIRADVYSLGCTLYHLLAGKVPFDNVHPGARLLTRQQQNPQLIEQHRPDAPAALGAVVRRMMARRPEDRFQTPADVAEALLPFTAAASVLNNATVPPIPPPLPAARRSEEPWPVTDSASTPGQRRERGEQSRVPDVAVPPSPPPSPIIQ